MLLIASYFYLLSRMGDLSNITFFDVAFLLRLVLLDDAYYIFGKRNDPYRAWLRASSAVIHEQMRWQFHVASHIYTGIFLTMAAGMLGSLSVKGWMMCHVLILSFSALRLYLMMCVMSQKQQGCHILQNR